MRTGKLILQEVGLRDGLQMEHQTVPTEQKIEWIRALAATGVDIIQVGSFVHPAKVPQMADTDHLFHILSAPDAVPPGVILSALVLNEKGLDRGLACGVQMYCLGVSASETHSLKNTGMSVADATDRIVATAQRALAEKKQVQVSVQSAFGCGFEGAVPQDRVLGIVRRYVDAGLRHISLADTAGHASPDQVQRMYESVLALDGTLDLACHFHNTYGMALANCYAAMSAGVNSFESSIAGLGGCPFTKIAGGNVCTEDLVHMWQRMGFRNDMHLDGLLGVAHNVVEWFQRDMPGTVYKTGGIPHGLHA
jgi:hydroxymethylglutaryl-CoA lyase